MTAGAARASSCSATTPTRSARGSTSAAPRSSSARTGRADRASRCGAGSRRCADADAVGDHARRPAVHHAAGDRGRARPAGRATTPSAPSTAARPGHPVVLSRRVLDAVGELEGDAGRARAARALPGAQVGGRAPGQRDRHRHARGALPPVKLEQPSTSRRRSTPSGPRSTTSCRSPRACRAR